MSDPQFALDLHHEEVILLVRRPDGWREMGRARLDDPRMDAALAELRAKAAAELPEGSRVSVRLVIPDSQILYLTVEAPGRDAAARLAETERALDGRTPYALDELAFDYQDLDGDRRLLAIVARETLAEADGFAAQHGFAPLCHVARPGPASGFRLEPYLGTAEGAADLLPEGETPARGGPPIRIAGPDEGPPPALPVFQSAAPRGERPEAPVGSLLGATGSRLSFGRPASEPQDAAEAAPAAPVFAPRREPSGEAPAPAPSAPQEPPSLHPRLAAALAAGRRSEGPDDETPEDEPSFLAELRRRREEARAGTATSRPVVTAQPRPIAQPPRDEAEALTLFGARGIEEPSRWRGAVLALAAVVAVLALLGGGGWWAWRTLGPMAEDGLTDAPVAPPPVIVAADPAAGATAPAATAPTAPPAPAPAAVPPRTTDRPSAWPPRRPSAWSRPRPSARAWRPWTPRRRRRPRAGLRRSSWRRRRPIRPRPTR
ncbi:MAG: hypothetical protein ACU0BS_03500 [Hasllibacter sp.]